MLWMLLPLVFQPAHAQDPGATKAPKAKNPNATKPTRITQRCAVDLDGDTVNEDIVLLVRRSGKATLLVIDADTIAFIYRGKVTTTPQLSCQPVLSLKAEGEALTWTWDGKRYIKASAPAGGEAVRPDP